MARTRLLKPSFFTNEVLAELPPITRILFAGLWCVADRDGKLVDRPKRIKAEILPYDGCDIEAMLTALADGGFISRYAAEGQNIIKINSFSKHQHPHKTEAASILPDNGETTVRHPLDNGSRPALTLNPYIDTLTLSKGDKGVDFSVKSGDRKKIVLKLSTLADAKAILPRADIHSLEAEWLGLDKGPPHDPDKAFLGFCRGYAKNHPELASR